MTRHPSALTVTILAGGHGSRLGGVDKAALDLDGDRCWITSSMRSRRCAAEIIVVANDDRLAGDPRFRVHPRSGARTLACCRPCWRPWTPQPRR